MISWLNFWAAMLVVAGASFAAITAVVTIKGYQDLKDMFRGLRSQQDQHE